MARIGITGHSNLSPDSVSLVETALRDHLRAEGDGELVGVTCLARGADQIFARAVLALGGTTTVVLPAEDYRERKVGPDNAAEFDALIDRATDVEVMPFERSTRDAYVAASERVLNLVERLVAVWDGQPSDGRGGTADVVAAARQRGIPVVVIWPENARRA
ncbi:hypothetical protein [Actinoalloteichus caeruleus]|uniref:Uncharacterized protein n=1 Tax=Actinoalloteichus caeruleus DSM 43889 TaxID=1120930 RepID=A0ABT1JNR1_ACTCY|nr:hypothetical protein [Actinoalloteichus caeruleus]MCP2333904.1 hypothetical protein [Actinoalloteichus caeruleus DSM 43889]